MAEYWRDLELGEEKKIGDRFLNSGNILVEVVEILDDTLLMKWVSDNSIYSVYIDQYKRWTKVK